MSLTTYLYTNSLACSIPPSKYIAPKNASGAALGVVGVASYVGAGIQDIMSGLLIEGNKQIVNGVDCYDFTYINYFWIGAALMSVPMTSIVWKAKPKKTSV